MMKKFLMLFLLSPILLSESIETSFNLSCVVTGQVIIQSKDGISKQYEHFNDSYVTGDKFEIEFSFTEYTSIKEYIFSINQESLFISESLRYLNSEKGYEGILYDDGFKYLLKDSFFRLNGLFSITSAERYYKNDWHIMVQTKTNVGGSAQTLVANCINMPQKWDEVIARIKELDKDKWTVLK